MGLLNRIIGIFGVNNELLRKASEENEIAAKIQMVRTYALYRLTGKLPNDPDIKKLNQEDMGPHKIIRKKKII